MAKGGSCKGGNQPVGGETDNKAKDISSCSFRQYFQWVILGAGFLSFLSLFQKMIIGARISPDGFIIPVLFGGVTGFLLRLWQCRLVRKNHALEKAGRQKDILLMELHHRVRNNLQLITSIMNLVRQCSVDEQSFSADLEKVHSRVLMLAHIQESIYDEDSFERVEVGFFLESVISYIYMSFHGSGVELTTDIPRLYCRLCDTMPLGMIVYEIISNSLIHAFSGPGDESPRVSISMRKNTAGQLLLKVSDNGRGLSAGISPLTQDPALKDRQDTPCESLGLNMIEVLVKQLKGQVRVDTSRGTAYTITLPCCGMSPGGPHESGGAVPGGPAPGRG